MRELACQRFNPMSYVRRHNLCEPCWAAWRGDRTPVVVKDGEVLVCCRCLKGHESGIYVIDAPRGLLPGLKCIDCGIVGLLAGQTADGKPIVFRL